jgi:hypothetical protein
MSDKLQFGCQNCGHPYTAYRPDSKYKDAYLEPCADNEGDPNHNRKMPYDCENCHFRNYLYWCPGHFFVGTVGRERGSEDLYRPSRQRYRESPFSD